ncbi:MFS transporter [Tindallia californiensis]|uniref:Predicted arabinose efflux permease, MFS family n=1 Tax=Tindallia californiensis TaxID=159292 RepID=A0A1H3MFE2_9FIRM|nr:MFS transporter [Tindallia californiensis]SDY75402.1 Predicted arabinose efflux permease, MFS family [Tindallia californiensis]
MNLWLMYVVTILMMTIFNSTFTLLPLYIIDLGGTEFFAGFQAALFYGVAILFRFYFGPLTDRVGRKIPLLIGLSIYTITSFFYYFSHSLTAITIIRIFQGIGFAAFISSAISAVADMAPLHKLGFYMAVYRIVSTLSFLTGPAASMHVAGKHGYHTWFLLCTFMGILSVLVLLGIRFPSLTEEPPVEGMHPMIKIIRTKKYQPVYLGIGITSMCYGALVSFVAIHVSRVTTISNPGIYFTFFALSSLFFTVLSGTLSDRLGRAKVAWPAIMLLGTGVALLLWIEIGQFPLFVLSSILSGIGFNAGLSVLSAWLVDLSSMNTRGSVLSLQESVIDFSIAFTSLAVGFVAGFTSLAMAFFWTGLIVFLLALWMFALTFSNPTSH